MSGRSVRKETVLKVGEAGREGQAREKDSSNSSFWRDPIRRFWAEDTLVGGETNTLGDSGGAGELSASQSKSSKDGK